MKVAVLGLGYVGAVTSVCLARDGHEVIGVDVDPVKLDLLRSGRSPIVEAEINDITKQAVESGRLSVLPKVDASIIECDLIFVCVGTPSARNGSQDLAAVERVAAEIGTVLADAGDRFPVVVMRSTVPAGTTDEVVKPILESRSGRTAGEQFGLCFQPEFLREGSSVRDFYDPPFTVAGGDERAVAAVRALFDTLPGEFIGTDVRSAELLKMACNTFHALKVVFANEIGRLGRGLGVDPRTVMDLLCRDHDLNISAAYLRPGFAFGGSCLPKDLRALLYLAKAADIELPMLEGVLPSNAVHIDHTARLVMESGTRAVGMVGLSFKQGTDDLRESPLVALAERLIGKGYDLRILDPAVSMALVIGSNRAFIEKTIPHIESLLVDDLDTLLGHSETLIVGHGSAELESAIAARPPRLRTVVDLAGLKSRPAAGIDYSGVAW